MNGERPAPAAERVALGLGQWPVVGALAAAHLLGLLAAFVMAGPLPGLSLGATVAVALLLGFLVLTELTLTTWLVAALELPATTERRQRLIDTLKSIGLAGLFTVLAASLVKFSLTGSHLEFLDLWFVGSNLEQLAGESLAAELGIAAVLLAFFALLTIVLRWAFLRVRQRTLALAPRTWLVLTLLATVGTATLLLRYEEIRTSAQRVAPELGWLLEPTPTLEGRQSATGFLPAGPVELDGPPIEPYTPQPPADSPNVLLVMIESVAANVLEDPQARRAIPNLIELSKESILFERAYAASVHSDYAQMAILSSLHPRKYRTHDFYTHLVYPRTLLWDALAPAGWETAMFSCQNEEWGNMLAYLKTPGLETLRHSLDFPAAPHRGRGDESKVFESTVVDAWQGWLDGRGDKPWLAYLNFQATHFPYEIPAHADHPFEPWRIDFPASFLGYPEDGIPVMRNRFLNALAWVDGYVGEVVRILEARGEWERTILVVVADHGEAFYEHGQPTHGTQLFEEQVRSLFLVRLPGMPARTVDQPVALLDLAPSLLDHLGLPPHGNFQGRPDIFRDDYSARGRPIQFTIQGLTDEDGILVDDWKLMVNWRTGQRQLYHVASDPRERDDLIEVEPHRAERLEAQLADFLTRQLTYYTQRGWEDGRYPERLP